MSRTNRSCLQPGRDQILSIRVPDGVISAVGRSQGLTSEELGSCEVLSNTPSAKARSTACRASSSSCCSSRKRLSQPVAIPTCNRRSREGLVIDGLGSGNQWNWQCGTGGEHWMAAPNFHEYRMESLTKHFHCHSLFWFLTQGGHYSHSEEVES